MMHHIPQPAHRPRLNPFVFPSDTSLRFILLLLSVLGATLWIYNSQLLSKTSDSVNYIEAKFRCTTESGVNTATKAALSDELQAWNHLDAAQNAYQQCMTPFYVQDVIRMGVGVVLLLTITAMIYLALPVWIRRRKRLVPLPLSQMPELALELSNLCHEAGLAQQPEFVWNPLNPRSEGFAFGHRGHYWVAVGGGLIKQFFTDRVAFRAVLRHELAHLSNADIDKTYLSVAIWWAFISTVLVPVACYQVINTTSGNFLANLLFDVNLLGHVVTLALLVLLTRNAVLRSRELYADVRASTVDGLSGGLHRLLAGAAQIKRKGRWLALSVHPDAQTRYSVVHDTSLLFRSSFWIAFNAGIAATVAFVGIFDFFSPLGSLLQSAVLDLVLAGLLLGGLSFGVVGSTLWRAIFAALAEGKKQYGIGRIACGVVLGCALGMILSFSSIDDLTFFSLNALGASLKALEASLLIWILWSLMLLGSLWLLLQWLTMVATTWLPVITNQKTLRWASRFSFTVAGAVWAVFFSALLYFGEAATLLGDIVLLVVLLVITLLLAQSFVVVGLIFVWAVPLVASFWYKRAASANEANWAFLDASAPRLPFTPDNPFRLRFTLMLGMLGALLFCGIELMLDIYLHVSLPETTKNTVLLSASLFYEYTRLSALFQAGIAAIVVLRVRRLSVTHALCAAFVGGCLMAIGILSINLIFGGKDDIPSAQLIFSTVINYGTILALLTGLCVSVLARWSSRTSPQPQAFSVRFAIAAGLLSIFAFCEILFVAYEAIDQVISTVRTFGVNGELDALQVGLGLLLPYVEMVMAILFEIATVVLVTVRARRLPVLQGLLAALMSASGIYFGRIMIVLWEGHIRWDFSSGVFAFWFIIVEGFSLSLWVILFMSILAKKGRQVLLSPIHLALRNGLMGSLPVGIVILIITLVFSLLPDQVRRNADVRLLFFIGQIALAVLVQGGVAAVTACRVTRLPFVFALLAAVVCGGVLSIGMSDSLFLLKGDLSPTGLLSILESSVVTCCVVIVLGLLLSLPVALALSLLTHVARRARKSRIERTKTAPLKETFSQEESFCQKT